MRDRAVLSDELHDTDNNKQNMEKAPMTMKKHPKLAFSVGGMYTWNKGPCCLPVMSEQTVRS